MKTVLLRLEGPLMSWGVRARFEIRDAGAEPSMSGVLGLVAAALGASRDDEGRLARLAACRMGCRVDREGRSLGDYHTVGGGSPEHRVHGAADPVVTHREYIADASFLVGLEYDDHELANEIDEALQDPAWLLFLGRKSCSPSCPVRAGLVDGALEAALRAAPWPWPDRPEHPVRLALPSAHGQGEPRNDVPVCFRSDQRVHRRRWVRAAWMRPAEVRLAGDPLPDPLPATPRARPAARGAARAPAETVPARVWLTRAFLHSGSPDVVRDLDDVHAMHRRVMGAFPIGRDERPRETYGVLHRVDRDPAAGRLVLLVQSRVEPRWAHLPPGYVLDLMGAVENPATTITSFASIETGHTFRFELRGNTVHEGAHDGRRRVDPRRWITGRASRAGFELIELQLVEEEPGVGDRPMPPGVDPLPLRFSSTRFGGRVRVTDPALFRAALVRGIGRGRAFGFGLLSITPG